MEEQQKREEEEQVVEDTDKFFKAKSLELIHTTKEYLQLEKSYEEGLSVLILIKNAKLLGHKKIEEALPKRILEFAAEARDLDEAEKLTSLRMSELKQRMDFLSPEIKRLSEELQPYLSQLKQKAL